jgi:hypothetical protein
MVCLKVIGHEIGLLHIVFLYLPAQRMDAGSASATVQANAKTMNKSIVRRMIARPPNVGIAKRVFICDTACDRLRLASTPFMI